MKPLALFPILAVLAVSSSYLHADIFINEIDADQIGTDTAEYVELYNSAATSVSLDGYVLVFYNGANNSKTNVYRAFDLDGQTIAANGFLVIGSTGAPNVNMVVTPVQDLIQNGPDAVCLFTGNPTDFPISTASTEASQVNLVDAVVYNNGTGTASALSDALLGVGATPAIVSDNALANPQSIQRRPDGGIANNLFTYQLADRTPGSTNTPTESLTLAFGAASIAENAGSAATTLTISRPGTSGTLTVTLQNPDASEITIPTTAIISDGTTSAVLAVDAVNDGWADGTQTVTITGTAAGYNSGTASINVTDDGDPAGLIINEVYAAVANGAAGDANLDGIGDGQQDEFVEIANVSVAPIDLTGFTLSDSVVTRHTFPAGSVLDPGCVLVVFGGGAVDSGRNSKFGSAFIQVASGTSFLGLNDGGDSVTVKNLAGVEVAGYVFGAQSSTLGSTTRSPDLTGNFVSHLAANGSLSYSPGLTTSAAAFCPLDHDLTLTFGSTNFFENAGPNATQLTISRNGPTTSAVTVYLVNSDASELSLPPTATIPSGSASVQVPVDAVDDLSADGDRTVRIVAHASGYLSSIQVSVVVSDNEPQPTIRINEVDIDQTGTDSAEFVEIYDGGVGNTVLDGLVLVFYNGSTDRAYRIIDLDGGVTNAQGFYVVGNVTVPNVTTVTAHQLPDSSIQNDTEAIAIYQGNGADFQTGTSGTLVSAVPNALVDAVVHSLPSGAANASGALTLTLLTAGDVVAETFSPSTAIARVPDGGAARSTLTYLAQTPTPGSTNSADFYETWRSGYAGLSPDKNEDDDEDSRSNLLEYAIGSDPVTPEFGPVGSVSYSPGIVTFFMGKGALAGADPKMDYRIEFSTDLQNWISTDDIPAPVDLSPLNEDATEFSVQYTGTSPTGYFRVRVNRN